MKTRIKSAAEIEAMRSSGRILAQVLELLKRATKPGLTPKHMAKIAAEELEKLNGEPAFKGYKGITKYPDIICISVNDQVQHSIPTDVPFKDGDIVNYDFGVRYRGMITDGGVTVAVGKINPDAERLLKGTKAALEAGLNVIKDGVPVGDVSAAIEQVLKAHKLGIVRELVGHGVGHFLHEEPNIPNYGKAGRGPLLEAGMTIAVEPIATLGGEQIVGDADGWTLWTADGSWSAQFEHTVLVTYDGIEILTKA